ncbi:unnamed protein product [Durusdinium trenchii]|uniref:SHSP domain-containing protein n=1 Tax=Durusdinium trenchii TaxID=1381693 RepID=A0ABP0QZI7_9DINO
MAFLMASRSRKNVRVLAFLTLLPGALAQGKPIVINLGPLMENSNLADLSMAPLVLGDAAPSAGRPLEAFQDTEEQLLRGLMDHFGAHMLPAMQSGTKGFQTEVQGDHFRLRASLPGYSMHRSSNGDEPLNVQVAGHTLVVQGSKSSGNMMTSFQRSFPLPWEPDQEHMQVTYSAQDGSLLVDVTKKPGAPSVQSASTAAQSSDDDMALDPFALLAPQLTMSFSDQGPPQLRRSRLRGLPMIVGLSNRGPMAIQDPFEQFWNDLADRAVDDDSEPATAIEQKSKITTSISPRSPVVVQPKKATPFWRLSESQRAKYIDIVSPPGVELGKVRGNFVEYSTTSGDGPQRLDLPISVQPEDLSRASTIESMRSKAHQRGPNRSSSVRRSPEPTACRLT